MCHTSDLQNNGNETDLKLTPEYLFMKDQVQSIVRLMYRQTDEMLNQREALQIRYENKLPQYENDLLLMQYTLDQLLSLLAYIYLLNEGNSGARHQEIPERFDLIEWFARQKQILRITPSAGIFTLHEKITNMEERFITADKFKLDLIMCNVIGWIITIAKKDSALGMALHRNGDNKIDLSFTMICENITPEQVMQYFIPRNIKGTPTLFVARQLLDMMNGKMNIQFTADGMELQISFYDKTQTYELD